VNSGTCDTGVEPAPVQPASFQRCCDVLNGAAYQEILGATSCIPCAPSSKW